MCPEKGNFYLFHLNFLHAQILK